MLRFYKNLISPFLHALMPKSGCRFYPTCSQYFSQSVKKYGLAAGGFKGIKRFLKCNPFHKGGYDPC